MYFYEVLGFPQITVEVTSYDVPVGESITFKCKIVSRLPVSSVMWWRKVDKKNLMIQTLYRNNDVIPQCPSFTIESVAVKDEGLYWCEAKNSIGSSKSPDINLVVNCGNYNFILILKSFFSLGLLIVGLMFIQCISLDTFSFSLNLFRLLKYCRFQFSIHTVY